MINSYWNVMPAPAPHCARATHRHFRMSYWYIWWNTDKNALGCFPYKK